MTIYTSVLFTDGKTILMCPCVLLANPGMLPYLMNVYAFMLCVYYICMHILAHYGSGISQCMECLYHYTLPRAGVKIKHSWV